MGIYDMGMKSGGDADCGWRRVDMSVRPVSDRPQMHSALSTVWLLALVRGGRGEWSSRMALCSISHTKSELVVVGGMSMRLFPMMHGMAARSGPVSTHLLCLHSSKQADLDPKGLSTKESFVRLRPVDTGADL